MFKLVIDYWVDKYQLGTGEEGMVWFLATGAACLQDLGPQAGSGRGKDSGSISVVTTWYLSGQP